MSWFSKMVDRAIKESVENGIAKALDETLPRVVIEIMDKGFREKPDRPLTRVGYLWAFALAMKRVWPDVDHELAIEWCKEDLTMAGITLGSAEYEWTARSAQEQVGEYVDAYGEHA